MEFKVLEKAFEGEELKSVFEIGCANGSFLKDLQLKYGDIVLGGLDINQKDIEIIKRNFPIYKDNFIHWDVNDKWPIKDNSYDVVFSVACLTLIKEKEKVIKEMLRVGKKVILVEPPDKEYFNFPNFSYKGVMNGRVIFKSNEKKTSTNN